MNKNYLILTIACALLTACASQQPYGYNGNYGYNNGGYTDAFNQYPSRTSNILIGSGVGAVAGAAIGSAFGGHDLTNAGLGALAGGAVGAAVGAYVDQQEESQYQTREYNWQQAPYYNGGYGQ